MKLSRYSSALAVSAFVCAAVISVGIHGGVPYPGTTPKPRPGSVFGESTGTLRPQPPPEPQPPFPGLVGPGVFHLVIPREDEGVGKLVLSLGGNTYLTFIDAVADPTTRRITGLITPFFPISGGQVNIAVKPINKSGVMKLKGFATVILDPFFAAQSGLPPIIRYKVSGSKIPNNPTPTPTATAVPSPTPTPSPTATPTATPTPTP